jgi:hypothetical protein
MIECNVASQIMQCNFLNMFVVQTRVEGIRRRREMQCTGEVSSRKNAHLNGTSRP